MRVRCGAVRFRFAISDSAAPLRGGRGLRPEKRILDEQRDARFQNFEKERRGKREGQRRERERERERERKREVNILILIELTILRRTFRQPVNH